MRSSLKTALFLSLILTHWGAQAQIYMCKDASGRTLTSDRPIPECAERAVRELDARGRTRREIPAPMSAEQKRQIQLEEEKRKAEEAATDEQRRNDRLIRSRHRSEADIEAARKRALEPVAEQIRREKATLAAAEKQQQTAMMEADAYRMKNAAMPQALQQQINESGQSVAASRKAIADHEAELAQINAKYDSTLMRYRELTGASTVK